MKLEMILSEVKVNEKFLWQVDKYLLRSESLSSIGPLGNTFVTLTSLGNAEIPRLTRKSFYIWIEP